MSKTRHRVYEFGPFRLEVDRQLFLREGQAVHLKPKVFDLLVTLVQSGGQVLTKENLMERLWPDSFVEENNLTVSIFALRKALGTIHDRQSYVRTIPRRGYRFAAEVRYSDDDACDVNESNPGVAAPGCDNAGHKGYAVKSLAVLPLAIIGTGLSEEYLGLGLADALITRLGNLKQVQVKPTSTIRKYAAANQDSLTVGRELGVDIVLEGSIRKAGERVRVTIQLVTVKEGVTLWAEMFDEPLTDIFVVEDSISRQVAGALRLKLTGAEERRLAKRQTISTEAYRAYTQGRFFCHKKNCDDVKKGITYFESAIELDAGYAQPYAGLAEAYMQLGNIEAMPARQAYLKAKQYVMQALQLDDDLAEAHTALGKIKMLNEWDWRGADEEFTRAIELNARYPLAHQIRAVYLRHNGRFDEALTETDIALELDPVSPGIITTRAIVLTCARRYAAAMKELERALELDGRYPVAHFAAGLAYTQQARYEEAIAEFRKVNSILKGQVPEVMSRIAYVYAVSGCAGAAQELIGSLTERARTEYISPYHIATIYAGLGRAERTFELLEQSYQDKDFELSQLKVDFCMDGLRADPRMTSLLSRIGLAA
jgi:DNA-binding winged helix-turn-helix (wHTH) protein/TolB-like protein/Flp pilus assembly protein TadD